MPVAPAMPPEIEVNTLKAQAGYLEQTLQTLRQRIQTLESESKNE
jgi:prefoldin subunit 5